jgi:hypothetical protein
MKNSSIYETDEDVDYEFWSSNHNANATLSMSKVTTSSLPKRSMDFCHGF